MKCAQLVYVGESGETKYVISYDNIWELFINAASCILLAIKKDSPNVGHVARNVPRSITIHFNIKDR